MSTEMYGSSTDETGNQFAVDIVDDGLIENLWRDLDGLIPHEKIRQVAMEIALEYQDVAVTTFLPIFIHRRTRERLEFVLGKGDK